MEAALSKLLIAPLEVLTTRSLTEVERRVLLVLYSFRGKNTEVVFPGIDAIADRAGYKDKTRVSKITSSLARKGWLEKRKKGFTGCNSYRLIVPEHESEDPNLDPDAKLDQEAKPNLDSGTNPNLDPDAKYKEQTIEQTIEEKDPPKKSRNAGKVIFKTWLQNVTDNGEKPIPATDPILKYAEDAGIPGEFIMAMWFEFKARYMDNPKKYVDWRATFRNAVRGNWFKLWWHDGEGYQLTSLGKQAMTAMSGANKNAN